MKDKIKRSTSPRTVSLGCLDQAPGREQLPASSCSAALLPKPGFAAMMDALMGTSLLIRSLPSVLLAQPVWRHSEQQFFRQTSFPLNNWKSTDPAINPAKGDSFMLFHFLARTVRRMCYTLIFCTDKWRKFIASFRVFVSHSCLSLFLLFFCWWLNFVPDK